MSRPMRYEVRNTEAERVLKEVGRALKEDMPPGFGFTLLIFSFPPGQDMFYLSSAERGSMIQAMREFIAKFEEN